ncbi:MAG TPA: caspase family protein [Jiangellaceae bacterium]|nr:caspase family protein [Jiangellaceae bacterium]
MKLALCIGVNKYAGAPLAGCVNDAEDWADVLGDRGFAVSTLVDGQATRAAILAMIEGLIESANYRDTVLIQFSGHGTWVPDRNGDEPDHRDEALCPVDYRQGLILDDDLHALFDARKHGVKVVMISDSCHSGSVTRFAEPLTGDGASVRFMPPEIALPPDELPRALIAQSTVKAAPRHEALLLSGCNDLEYSYDASFQGRPNGAFTYVALRALNTLAPNATYRDWLRAVRNYLPSQDLPQTPQLYGTSTMKRWPVL